MMHASNIRSYDRGIEALLTRVEVLLQYLYVASLAEQYMALSSTKLPAFLSSTVSTGVINALYHNKVIDHYEHPRNVGTLDKNDPNVGTGIVGSPACGDVMKLQIKVDENGKIIDAKFKTFGCGSAIASSSLASEWIKGKTTEYASKVKNDEIAKELCLPPVKLHCSMLAQDAIQAALKTTRKNRKNRMADDIEQAVLTIGHASVYVTKYGHVLSVSVQIHYVTQTCSAM
ncbi:Iron-sulfur cluster assembly enzyme ISCU, mitochondrial [Dirofilaria immitis]|nr:Iron-sulfur cluster assembly enzyme ISCU, mitochondrial [Dirofilaria immitis]